MWYRHDDYKSVQSDTEHFSQITSCNEGIYSLTAACRRQHATYDSTTPPSGKQTVRTETTLPFVSMKLMHFRTNLNPVSFSSTVRGEKNSKRLFEGQTLNTDVFSGQCDNEWLTFGLLVNWGMVDLKWKKKKKLKCKSKICINLTVLQCD